MELFTLTSGGNDYNDGIRWRRVRIPIGRDRVLSIPMVVVGEEEENLKIPIEVDGGGRAYLNRNREKIYAGLLRRSRNGRLCLINRHPKDVQDRSEALVYIDIDNEEAPSGILLTGPRTPCGKGFYPFPGEIILASKKTPKKLVKVKEGKDFVVHLIDRLGVRAQVLGRYNAEQFLSGVGSLWVQDRLREREIVDMGGKGLENEII